MKKGIIMEIRRDVLIMMTPDGQFMNGKKVRNQQYLIGEEIPFFPVKKESRLKVKRNWKTAASILTAAVLMLSLLSASFLQTNKAYAYVSVDINPSLELTLNKDQQVLEITPYNDDAEILMKKLKDWEKDDVSEVAEEILRMSEKLGYLKDDQNVWITSTFTEIASTETHSALLKDLNEFVKLYNDQHSAEIIMNETTDDLRDEAVNRGVTAGTLLKETVNKENEIIANPAEGKEKKFTKEPVVEEKSTIPAASSNDEKEKKIPNGLKQDNKASYSEKSNNGRKNQNSDSEKNNRNNGSDKAEDQSNRSHPKKKENKSDNQRNKSDEHEGRTFHQENKANNQQKQGNENKDKDKGKKETNH
jgi:hypothetical protein